MAVDASHEQVFVEDESQIAEGDVVTIIRTGSFCI
jgi:hypothetical protein